MALPKDYDPDDIWLDYGGPPPEYDPPVADPMNKQTPGALSTNVLARACVGVILLVLALLWWIGIHAESDLK